MLSVGGAEFETNINRITVDIRSFSPPPPPLLHHYHPHPLQPRPSKSLKSPSPLLRDVGSTSTSSAPSEAKMQAQLPLPFLKECGWFSLTQRRIRGGRKTKGTHEVGSPSGEFWNTSHDTCHGSFLLSTSYPPHWRIWPCHQDETTPWSNDEHGRKWRRRGRWSGWNTSHDTYRGLFSWTSTTDESGGYTMMRGRRAGMMRSRAEKWQEGGGQRNDEKEEGRDPRGA